MTWADWTVEAIYALLTSIILLHLMGALDCPA